MRGGAVNGRSGGHMVWMRFHGRDVMFGLRTFMILAPVKIFRDRLGLRVRRVSDLIASIGLT